MLPLPRRVVRHLLRAGLLRRSRRVLDVGCGAGELVAALGRRGVEAHGIDDRPAEGALAVDTARLAFRGFSGAFPHPPHHFDLVLVREVRTYAVDLRGPEALTASANLLSSLRPRGRLVFLVPGHEADAAARIDGLREHLTAFPGTCDVRRFEDGIGRFLDFEWLIGRHRNVELMFVTLRVDRKPVTRLKWHQLAREAVLRRQAAPGERAA